MKQLHSNHFCFFIHIFSLWLIVNRCSAEKPKPKLNEDVIDELYVPDDPSTYNFTPGVSGGRVIFATERATIGSPHEKKVVIKLQKRGEYSELKNEIGTYARLQNHYGNLVKCHILNVINHGTFNFSGEAFDVLILDRAGITIEDKEMRNRNGKYQYEKGAWQWPWRTVCKIMTDMLIALEHLHQVDIIHFDIYIGNTIFGAEPEPENRRDKRDDVMYDTDVFLFDFGKSRDLRKVNESESEFISESDTRLEDICDLGGFLYHLVEGSEEFSYFLPQQSDLRKFTPKERADYLKAFFEKVRSLPELKDVPAEKEKKHALIEFFTLFGKLYDGWTETRSAINYNTFKKIFEISGEVDKKGENKGATGNKKGAQKEDKKKGKKLENKKKSKKWMREVLTQMNKRKLNSWNVKDKV